MKGINEHSIKPRWAVADAKAHFSEIMRNAWLQGAQYIGTKNPCVLVSEDEWQRLNNQKPKLGSWLTEHFVGLGEIELPDRTDPPRESPFGEQL
jgi:hypothetical protein